MITKKIISTGVVHKIPDDFKKALLTNSTVLEKWNKLTPLARNEWICWITSVKKDTTRNEHIIRTCEDLQKNKKRPCCWPGCPHRKNIKNN